MNPWPISPLGTKDLDFAVVNYDFTGLTAGELQPLPALEDLIDATLLDAALSVTDQTGLFDSVESDFSDLSSIADEMGGDDFAATVTELTPAATAGDAALADFTSLIGTGSGGSGGGGGTGGGTGGVSNPQSAKLGDTVSIDWGRSCQNIAQVNIIIHLTNQTPYDLAIDTVTHTYIPGNPVFQVVPANYGDTIKPNAVTDLAVIVDVTGTGDTSDTMVVTFKPVQPQAVTIPALTVNAHILLIPAGIQGCPGQFTG
jgi:hypothetical protein